ncbi:MAG: sialidase, partial [Saprospiraceae bacterium]|nr:sialidase [Saprospiraceae bacterium]
MLITAFIIIPQEGDSQKLEKEHLDQLKFRHIGPIGNRINSVSGVPGDPLTYVVGAASGGVWKTVDGGLNWMPIFDKQEVHAIGSLTICPSDPQIIYVGTGESFIRSNVSIGNGMYKSTDGGESWSHIGLENTGRISRVIVHPENPDIVYVAALGHAYSPQPERGIYRSMDGGETWEHVLFVDENTGASDIVMDPDNPRILFAGTWQLELKTWKRNSGGPGSGVQMSNDAGKTWKKLQGNGLPKGPVGKVALAMTPAKPDRVYALIETGDGVPLELEGQPTETGELWRSDNNGKSFQLVSSNRDLGGRGAYYTRCAASPDNPHEVYFMAAGFTTSIDGGKSVHPVSPFSAPNWDHHEMWIDPTDGNRMVVVGDGGVSISQNRGVSWLRNF